jgi:hypothetical protein
MRHSRSDHATVTKRSLVSSKQLTLKQNVFGPIGGKPVSPCREDQNQPFTVTVPFFNRIVPCLACQNLFLHSTLPGRGPHTTAHARGEWKECNAYP